MKLLQEMKGVQYTLNQTVYYGYQQYIRSEASPLYGQPTVLSMFARQKRGAAMGGGGGAHGPVEIMTRKVCKYFVEFLSPVFHGHSSVWGTCPCIWPSARLAEPTEKVCIVLTGRIAFSFVLFVLRCRHNPYPWWVIQSSAGFSPSTPNATPTMRRCGGRTTSCRTYCRLTTR